MEASQESQSGHRCTPPLFLKRENRDQNYEIKSSFRLFRNIINKKM